MSQQRRPGQVREIDECWDQGVHTGVYQAIALDNRALPDGLDVDQDRALQASGQHGPKLCR